MSKNAWQEDRGNKDRSITKAGTGTMGQGVAAGADARPDITQAFLVGDGMTGGYGSGADILDTLRAHLCQSALRE